MVGGVGHREVWDLGTWGTMGGMACEVRAGTWVRWHTEAQGVCDSIAGARYGMTERSQCARYRHSATVPVACLMVWNHE